MREDFRTLQREFAPRKISRGETGVGFCARIKGNRRTIEACYTYLFGWKRNLYMRLQMVSLYTTRTTRVLLNYYQFNCILLRRFIDVQNGKKTGVYPPPLFPPPFLKFKTPHFTPSNFTTMKYNKLYHLNIWNPSFYPPYKNAWTSIMF